jgi:hypothetical protein
VRSIAACLLAAALAPVGVAQAALQGVPAHEVPQASSDEALPNATQIVERNAAARGGVQAWQKLQTMVWTGYAENGSVPGSRLPFLLEQKRPNKTRFELMIDGGRSVRMYDGKAGWKQRPNPANGMPESVPYTEDELRFARGAQVIEGPLMDYVAHGAVVTLAGTGAADGQRAYILDVKLPSGGDHRIWVDARTFLEVRQDRQFSSGAGRLGTVSVVYRDYRTFEGLQMPTSIETGAAPGAASNRLVIERVALNPDLDDGIFARPELVVRRRKGVIVDTRGVGADAAPRAARPAAVP